MANLKISELTALDVAPADNDLLEVVDVSDTSMAAAGTNKKITFSNLGLVPKSLFDANTILIASSDDTPTALTVGASTIVGRKATGGIVALTTSELKTLLALDHGADLTGLGDDDHTQYHTDARALTWLGTRSTSDLSEGTRLYFTDERAQDAVGTILTDSASIDFTYNDGANTITATVIQAGIDHGSIGGLSDDDHSQYIFNAPAADARNLITIASSTVTGLTIKGAASQSDPLIEFQNSSGVAIAKIAPAQWQVPDGGNGSPGYSFLSNLGTGMGVRNGDVAIFNNTFLPVIITTGEIRARNAGMFSFSAGNNDSASDTYISRNAAGVIQLGNSSTYHSLILGTAAAGTQPMRVRGTTSQTANLTEWLDVSSNILSAISENGYFTTRKTSAPADGELSAGEVALWYDSTDGAAKLKIKGKSANGTVVAGEVALA